MKDQKRNHNPSAVRVLTMADLKSVDTLDARVDMLVENRNEVVIHNIAYILQKNNIPQSHMCNVDLEGSPQPPQLAAYKQAGRDIPFRIVARIAAAYGYPPEQLYGQLLDQGGGTTYIPEKPAARPYNEYMKYTGTYHMAYFSTDAQLGSNKRTTARALAYGVLSVYADGEVDGVPNLQVIAFTNCTDEERNRLIRIVRSAEEQKNIRGVQSCYEAVAGVYKEGTDEQPRAKCLYRGQLTLTDRIAKLTMHQVHGNDTVHIDLHNRAAISSEGSPYCGGLGNMMSTSRGEEHMPCGQAVILTKRDLDNVAKEEVAAALFLEPPKINLHEEIKDIVNSMKALFPADGAESPLSQLSDADKYSILESLIEQKLTEVIKRNVLGYYKVSTAMDSHAYKAFCR